MNPWDLLHDNDFTWDDVNAIAAVLDHHDLDIRPRADGPNAGHRTHIEHDCFVMNCRDLGPQVRELHEALAKCSSQLDLALRRYHVPTPEELDVLLADVSCTSDAPEAVEIVENWTRKWWHVESTVTTRMNTPGGLPAGYEPEDAPALGLAVDALKRAIAEDGR